MHSQADIHRYSVANIITKTSATEAISLIVILYHILFMHTLSNSLQFIFITLGHWKFATDKPLALLARGLSVANFL